MTNKELAKQLDISPTALSFILNNKPGVSADTRNRVISQLKDLGLAYLISSPGSNPHEPDAGKTLTFVIYKRHGKILNQHPYFLLLMESLENRAQKYGYNLIIKTIDKLKNIDEQVQLLNSISTTGYIIFGTEMMDDDILYLNTLNRPFIVIDNNFSFHELNTIAIDNQLGTYQAIEYLYGMGHRKIGYLKSETRISSFHEREQGYIDALHHFQLDLNPDFVFELPYTEELSYQSFKSILNTHPELPTAFVTDDDTIASGVMKAFNEFNIQIPEEISIIGFNDRPLCRETIPHLSTINVPRNSFGSETIDSLIRIIENSNSTNRSIKIRIGTQLIIRKSVNNIN